MTLNLYRCTCGHAARGAMRATRSAAEMLERRRDAARLTRGGFLSLASAGILAACNQPSPLPTAPTPVPTPTAVPTRTFGVNLTYGIYEAADLPLVTATGASLVRIAVAWNDIETQPGVYDWSAYDAILPSLQAADLDVILVAAVTNPIYFSDAPATAAQLQSCATFHALMAQRYPNCWWEIGNEPDTAYFWAPAPSASAYAAYLDAVTPAVAPCAKQVITAGLSGMDMAFFAAFLPLVRSSPTMLGIHPYGETAQTLPAKLTALRVLTGLPIICTEYGTQGATQADDLTAMAGCCGAHGIPFVWYTLVDGTPEPDGSTGEFGLYAQDGTPNASLAAAQAFTGHGSGSPALGLAPL